MATNLVIDDKLIEEARKIGGHRTKKAAVIDALEEYIQHCKQLQILKVFNRIDFNADYDYKEQRKKQRKERGSHPE